MKQTAIRNAGVSWEPEPQPPREIHLPTIVHGMPFSEYLATEGYGSGAIRQFIKSPAHFLHYTRTKGEPPTPQMLLGSAAHCAVLEPREFNARYAKAPAVDRRTKAGKEEWAEFVACNPHKEILTPEQHDTAWAIKDTLAAMPEYRQLLARHDEQAVEVSRFWVDDATGIKLKARADMTLGRSVVVDLKTAADASPRGFSAAMARYGYHCQAGMYCEAFGADEFAFVVVENKPPFACGVYRLDEASLELGRQMFRQALAGIARCEHEGVWPVGYGAQEISLPAYVFYDNEDEPEVTL
jgi:hypothetical protein